MNDKEILEFEDRAYVSPTVSRDEQMDFIQNYRNVLQENVNRINAETHNLGTDVPSNLGGLTGGEATFESRYVTPQANAVVANLKAQAQETALTQSLNNLKAQMNKRYKDAYRNARINEYNKNKSGGSGSQLNVEGKGSDGTKKENKVEDNPNTGEGYLVMTGEGVGTYTRDGKQYTLRDITSARDQIALGQAVNPFKEYNDGDTVTYSGVTLRYINNEQYPGRWFIQE